MQIKFIAVLLSAVVLLSNCAYKKNEQISDQSTQYVSVTGTSPARLSCPSIEETVRKFSSAEYKGRLTGTEENARAAEEIASIFLRLHLDWFANNSYLHQYEHIFTDQQRQKLGIKENKVTASNVIGMIPGKDRKSAIVISAHFDHIGSADGKIYYGAVDNCSGLSILIDVAKKLKEFSKDKEIFCDIIICAFNGEEFGLQGSSSFVKTIKGVYNNIICINLESLHGKEDKELIIVGDATIGSNLINLTKMYFSKYNFDCRVVGLKYNGDHLSFSSNGIKSITIGQVAPSYLHTPEDTPDKIDYSFLEKVSNCLYGFIIAHDDELFN